MKNSFQALSKQDRILTVVRIVISVLTIIFSLLRLLHVWENATFVAIPLLGVLMLTMGLQEWKRNRTSAILLLVVALFIFIVSIVNIFSK
ncbi:MAG: YczI family protein [Clostridia bacterium]|nr:YczI family protein [Clostridia bacterium]